MPDGTVIDDTKRMIEELSYPETFASNFETVSKDGYKMLNTNRFYSIENPNYWHDFNRRWLDEIVAKKADVVVLSDKSNDLLKYQWTLDPNNGKVIFRRDQITNELLKTGFGKEIEYMENLVQQGKYEWKSAMGVYKNIQF